MSFAVRSPLLEPQTAPGRVPEAPAYDLAFGRYLPGLNAIRFLAAAVVVLSHVEQVKFIEGLPSRWIGYPANAESAVELFFALSGFLITHLLLCEAGARGTIDVKAFYVRRMLRIWPLYYAVVLGGFFLVPALIGHASTMEVLRLSQSSLDQAFWAPLLLNVFLLPNEAAARFGAVFLVSNCWSLGYEEQFYLFWPWAVRTMKRYFPAAILLAIVVQMFLLEPVLHWLRASLPPGTLTTVLLESLNYVRRFHFASLAFGALGALLLHRHPGWVRKYFHAPAAAPIAVALLLVGLHYRPAPWTGALFALVLLAVCRGRLGFLKLETPVLDYLGKLSYSIYLLHGPCIVAMVYLFQRLPGRHFGWLFSGGLYGATFALLLPVSVLSYRYLETPFLRWKRKWETV